MNKVDPRQRITRVVEGWFLSEPLLFAAWTMHETVAQPEVATIRVGRGRIEFNPKFISSLSNENLREVLSFETMRILLGHPYSRRQANAELSYAASNLSVQECLRTRLPIPRARDVLGGKEHDHQYFEYYYRELFERQREQPEENESDSSASSDDDPLSNDEGSNSKGNEESASKDGGNDEGGKDDADGVAGENEESLADSSTPDDDLSDNNDDIGDSPSGDKNAGNDLDSYADPDSVGLENTQSWDSDDLLQEELSIAIQEAAQGDGWGTLAGYAKEQLKATLKPPMDYRGVLRQFRQSVLSVDRRLTRMKPSRRYGFGQMGSRYDFTTSLLFAVDVSGSMSREDLELGFSVVNRFFQYGIRSMDVVHFDTRILEPPATFRRAKHNLEVTGRGGTDFQCLVDFIDGRSEWIPTSNYNGLIVFTDGLAPIPSPPKNRLTRILWLFHTEEAYRRSSDSLGKLGSAAFLRPAVSHA